MAKKTYQKLIIKLNFFVLFFYFLSLSSYIVGAPSFQYLNLNNKGVKNCIIGQLKGSFEGKTLSDISKKMNNNFKIYIVHYQELKERKKTMEDSLKGSKISYYFETEFDRGNLNEEDKTGTLIEIFENSQVWENVGNKLIGSPINLRLRELFTIEKITVLGEISDEFKDKLKQMSSPVVKSYVGGIRQE